MKKIKEVLMMMGVVGISSLSYAQTGTSFSNPVPAGNLVHGAYYNDTRNNSSANGYQNIVGQPSNDIIYSFSLSQNSNVTLSHCSSGLYDTYMSLYNYNYNLIGTNDDYGPSCPYDGTSSLSLNLVPGTYYVVSEGYSNYTGSITTEISVKACTPAQGNTMANPYVIGTSIGPCFSFSDYKHNGACFGNEYVGQKSEDIYYRFTLLTAQTVTISNCGSEIADSYLTLLDANGTYLFYNDDAPNCSNQYLAYISRNLSAGTYYIVQEGYGGNTGWVKLNFSTPGTCRLEEEVSHKMFNTVPARTAGISLYPNPAAGSVMLNIPDLQGDIEIHIQDISGRILKTVYSSLPGTEINTSDLPEGICFVSFSYNNKTETRKLQIRK